MRRCYFSKNYKGVGEGGDKARTDMESIMSGMGFVNVGLKQSFHKNKAVGFVVNLAGVTKACFSIRKGDILVLQYPLKKYYRFLCRVAHLKGARVITLIHDLGAFRRKRLTPAQEKKRLSRTDAIIALNDSMKEYLMAEGYNQPITTLEAWDYASQSVPRNNKVPGRPYNILYAGGLDTKKHSFFFQHDMEISSDQYTFTIYSPNFEYGKIKHKEIFRYCGFVQSDEIIAESQGDFGLVWYGHTVDGIDGPYGEYLRITTPHKPSLYVRCHIPVIIWKESANADFIEKEGIGIAVSSLRELDGVLRNMSAERYAEMKDNTVNLSRKLSQGYFFRRAYETMESQLSGNRFERFPVSFGGEKP